MTISEKPQHLAPINDDGNTPLRQWRIDKGIDPHKMAEQLEMHISSLYRYEQGGVMRIDKVNDIVSFTRGAVRYRDLIGGFKPEYA